MSLEKLTEDRIGFYSVELRVLWAECGQDFERFLKYVAKELGTKDAKLDYESND